MKYAYSHLKNQRISATEAHLDSLSGINDAFTCINEDCNLSLICTHYGKKVTSKQRIYFRKEKNSDIHTGKNCIFLNILTKAIEEKSLEKITIVAKRQRKKSDIYPNESMVTEESNTINSVNFVNRQLKNLNASFSQFARLIMNSSELLPEKLVINNHEIELSSKLINLDAIDSMYLLSSCKDMAIYYGVFELIKRNKSYNLHSINLFDTDEKINKALYPSLRVMIDNNSCHFNTLDKLHQSGEKFVFLCFYGKRIIKRIHGFNKAFLNIENQHDDYIFIEKI